MFVSERQRAYLPNLILMFLGLKMPAKDIPVYESARYFCASQTLESNLRNVDSASYKRGTREKRKGVDWREGTVKPLI